MTKFKFTRNTKTITDIYNDFVNENLQIDNSYQRRKVWLEKDNIALIETILLNLVIPEIFLWPASIDPDTGKTVTHIVDGQQRIRAIVDFISNKFKLKPRYLLITDSDEIDIYGDKYFKDLPAGLKARIWKYEMSLVNIDQDCKIDMIKKMFYRLNLTDYNLNDQEKRHSKESAFKDAAIAVVEEPFWDTIKVFSSSDFRRMKDIEYCSSILILAREGIIDQTTQKPLNNAYDDFQDEYPGGENDIDKVKAGMGYILELLNQETKSFLSKKTQLYTAFSIAFYYIEKEKSLAKEIVSNFSTFVKVYDRFRNEIEINFEDDEKASLAYDYLKRYKLASSEGVNKVSNRMIRFDILTKIFEEESLASSFEKVYAELNKRIDLSSYTDVSNVEENEY